MVLGFGAIVVFLALGMRHAFGLFLDPITRDVEGISREAFGFALALQNLLWGLAQPFAGIIADRWGSARVIFVCGALYAAGLALASQATGPMDLNLSMGVLIGLGLSGTSYAVVLGAIGRRFPPHRRSTALGLASVGGSIGMFCSVPLTMGLTASLGWTGALLVLAGIALTMCLAAPQLAGNANVVSVDTTQLSLGEALNQALKHRGFLLLVTGFFVCGFQLAFIVTHLPAFLLDRALEPWAGGLALSVIGAANIVGTVVCGALGDRFSKKKLLAGMYLIRAMAVTLFLLLPVTVISTIWFSVVMGLTWLGTVPLTTGIVAQVFGPRYLSTLVGIVFLLHQTGSFMGAWLGGYVFALTGSYDLVWWLGAALAVAAAVLHWPIDEQPIQAVPLTPVEEQ